MFSFIWHTIFFDPVYNALIFFIDVVPGGDVGLAVVLLTFLVKVLLLPLSLKASRNQRAMQLLEPKLGELREKHKDDKETHAREMMTLYKEAGVNPFASIAIFFVQIPFIIALYLAVYSGGGVRLPLINADIVYAMLPHPDIVRMTFLGIMDIASKSLLLALLAGVTQYLQAHITLPKPVPRPEGAEGSFREDFARSMQLQMRYMMPVIIFFVAYTVSAVIALYFVVSNILGIIQEYIVRREKIRSS